MRQLLTESVILALLGGIGGYAIAHLGAVAIITMARNSHSNRKIEGSPPPGSQPDAFAEEYKVGPGRPPKEFQFKPGQSGNPKGAKRKPPSATPDLKLLLERALSTKVKLKQGEKEQIVTKAAAGIEQLVNQFAKGDRHARRDLIALADKLGVDLLAGQRNIIQEALATNRSGNP